MDADRWNQRYDMPEYFYGEQPNGFVAAHAYLIPPGPVLCLAEGEGRNAVFLAGCGHPVEAVDGSSVGMAKAHQLATRRGVTITTHVADLADFVITPGHWSGIIATFTHFPPPLRRQVHAAVVAGLRPGGIYLLEAYTPAQLAHGTGGPKEPALLMQLDDLRAELAGLEFEIGREIERKVTEGLGHTGLAAVVQVAARRRD